MVFAAPVERPPRGKKKSSFQLLAYYSIVLSFTLLDFNGTDQNGLANTFSSLLSIHHNQLRSRAHDF